MDFSDIKGEYKQINGFDDYYITEHGDVYSTRPIGYGGSTKLRKLKPKNPGKKNKYYNIILCKDGLKYTKSIHRLVAEHFVDGYFEGAVVNHIDGNNRNNDASNLEWTTTRDNVVKSYSTSGLGAKRNYKIWRLYDKDGKYIETFTSHMSLKSYILSNNIDASPSQLIKCRNSRGYTVVVKDKATENCNDYLAREYMNGETPFVEVPTPAPQMKI